MKIYIIACPAGLCKREMADSAFWSFSALCFFIIRLYDKNIQPSGFYLFGLPTLSQQLLLDCVLKNTFLGEWAGKTVLKDCSAKLQKL